MLNLENLLERFSITRIEEKEDSVYPIANWQEGQREMTEIRLLESLCSTYLLTF